MVVAVICPGSPALGHKSLYGGMERYESGDSPSLNGRSLQWERRTCGIIIEEGESDVFCVAISSDD